MLFFLKYSFCYWSDRKIINERYRTRVIARIQLKVYDQNPRDWYTSQVIISTGYLLTWGKSSAFGTVKSCGNVELNPQFGIKINFFKGLTFI